MDEGFVRVGAGRYADEASAMTALGALIQITGENLPRTAFWIARNILPAILHIDLTELGMFAGHAAFCSKAFHGYFETPRRRHRRARPSYRAKPKTKRGASK